MATIGQIVYNLEDYNSSGGLISTSSIDTSTTISSNNGNYETVRLNIFTTELVAKFTSGAFSKLGIQAPSGTKVVLNSNKTIMVGRTGVYELDEDINITSLIFIRPYKYILDTIATDISLSKGITAFEEAERDRQSSLNSLNAQYENKDKDAAYWEAYTDIQENYDTVYNSALSDYTSGVNGIYVLPNPEDLDDDANYEELYNIIVDFMY